TPAEPYPPSYHLRLRVLGGSIQNRRLHSKERFVSRGPASPCPVLVLLASERSAQLIVIKLRFSQDRPFVLKRVRSRPIFDCCIPLTHAVVPRRCSSAADSPLHVARGVRLIE